MREIARSSLVDQFVRTFEDATGSAVSREWCFDVPFRRQGATRLLDLLLSGTSPDGPFTLAIEILDQAYPRDVRKVAWDLEEYRLSDSTTGMALPFVIAQYLSPGSRASLRDRNIGYFDAGGSLFLKNGNRLIDIDRHSSPTHARRALDLFSGARERVVHALLHSGRPGLRGRAIASLADVSTYTVSVTMRELERRELLKGDASGPNPSGSLSPAGALLDAWKEAWNSREQRRSRWFGYEARPNTLMSDLAYRLHKSSLEDWAFTGASAANILAPLLTSVSTIEVIVPPGASPKYATAMELESADKGYNVILIEREGASTQFRRQHPAYRAWLASPFIQYLDLEEGRSREKELAYHLRQKILKI